MTSLWRSHAFRLYSFFHHIRNWWLQKHPGKNCQIVLNEIDPLFLANYVGAIRAQRPPGAPEIFVRLICVFGDFKNSQVRTFKAFLTEWAHDFRKWLRRQDAVPPGAPEVFEHGTCFYYGCIPPKNEKFKDNPGSTGQGWPRVDPKRLKS